MDQIKELLIQKKKEKGEVSWDDLNHLMGQFTLTEEQLDELISWITQNDLNISLENRNHLTNPYFTDVSVYPLLSPQQEKQLAKQVRNKDKLARDKFIKANLRLVIDIASQYSCPYLSSNDLIQEGNLGLFTAVDKYDPDKGVPFNYYASFWIKKSIMEAINKAQLINIPQKIFSQIQKINDVIEQYQQQYNVTPTNPQIAQQLHITSSRVEQLLNYQYSIKSMDEDNGLMNLITVQLNNDPFAIERLYNVIHSLSDRQQQIISEYYGLNNQTPKNMSEIAQELGLTKQRVNQLLKEALKRIKELYDK